MASAGLLLALLLGLLAPTRALAQGQPTGAAPGAPTAGDALSLAAYTTLLEEAATTLAAEPTVATLRKVALGVNRVRHLRLPTGETVVLIPLLANVQDPDAALVRLTTVTAQVEAAAGDDLAARSALLATILARREFAVAETLFDRLLRWLQEWLARVFPSPKTIPSQDLGISRVGNAIFNILLILAGGGLVLALAWWLTRILRGVLGGRDLRQRPGMQGDPQTSAEARALAHEQAQSGSYRVAVRSLYLSALLGLEEARVIPIDRTFTNRELLARVRDEPMTPPLRPALAPVIEAFEPIWYGIQEPDSATFAAYRATVDELNLQTAARSHSETQPPPSAPAATAAGRVP